MGDMELEVTLYCGLCETRHEQKIPMPAGWDTRYRSISEEHGFCPKHAPIVSFADSQCPGCVGGWGDCPLWKSFAYRKLELTHEDFDRLESGICPKRVNGTLMVSRSQTGAELEEVDLRSAPVVQAGKELAQAIREYAAKYHKET